MPKSRARNVYEKLHPSDQDAVNIKTGRKAGVIFTKAWPRVSFDEAVRDVAGRPGTYTTERGGILKRKASKTTIGQ